jgi:Flp pilus assembly protein TadD
MGELRMPPPREQLAQARRLWRERRLDEAEQAFRQAIQFDPHLAEAHNELGAVLHAQGKLQEAEAAFSTAIQIQPRLAAAYSNASRLLRPQNRLDQAIDVARAGLRVMPSLAELHYNLGSALLAADRVEESIAEFQQTLAQRSDHLQAWNELGQALKALGRYPDAMQCYDRALQLDPRFPDAHVNKAILLLLLGNLTDGFREYEWRWHWPPFGAELAKFAAPLWDGSHLSGNTILIHAEQGLGDTIQFARYASLLKDRGARRVILSCQPSLVTLIRSTPGVDNVIERGTPAGEHDCHCPLLSLPHRLGTILETIPRDAPYLFAAPDRIAAWKQKLGNTSALRVGLAWSSNPKNPEGGRKCCPLEQFAPLSVLQHNQFHSLQIGPAAQALRKVRLPFEVIDWSAHIRDFADTAALIAHLDVVVSVDTAVCHLAGAMGKRTFTLLPRDADWRWLTDRADSPWYPMMRLIRQPSAGAWDAVMRELAGELLKWMPEQCPIDPS